MFSCRINPLALTKICVQASKLIKGEQYSCCDSILTSQYIIQVRIEWQKDKDINVPHLRIVFADPKEMEEFVVRLKEKVSELFSVG